MDTTSKIFVERTKQLLKEQGFKQKDLAAFTGYTDSGLSTLFSKGNQSFEFLKRTALMLGTTTDHLLGLSDDGSAIEKMAIPIVEWDHIPKLANTLPSAISDAFAIYYGNKEGLVLDKSFCVRAPDSFAEPEYYEGDIVLIEPTNDVSSHELALIYIPKMDQSVICYAKKGFLSYALVPRNEEFSDSSIKLKPDEIKIIGKCLDILKEEI